MGITGCLIFLTIVILVAGQSGDEEPARPDDPANCIANEVECGNGFCDERLQRCQCRLGWTGDYCQQEIPSACSPGTCLNGAACEPSVDQRTFQCYCADGFTGSKCETDINECELPGGGCLKGGKCTNLLGSHSCQCDPKVARGQYCQIQPNGTPYNICDENICLNEGECEPNLDYPYLFICLCSPGWGEFDCSKATCRQDIRIEPSKFEEERNYRPLSKGDIRSLDDYFSQPGDYCLYGGECEIIDNSKLPTCTCNPGYRGTRCQEPYTVLLNVVPTFGPESGGTYIEVIGRNLNFTDLPTIHIGDTICATTIKNESALFCETKPGNISEPLEMSIYWNSTRKRMNLKRSFTYMEDPTISKVEPLESIISGGVFLTVTGFNVNSVAFPGLIVTIEFEGYILDRKETICTVVNSTTMLCPTPDLSSIINKDGDLVVRRGQPQRRKRELLPDVDLVANRKFLPAYPPNEALVAHRLRRVADSGQKFSLLVNNETLDFYIGLKLDGVRKYQNLSKALGPEYGKLDVYIDPVINRWKADLTVKSGTQISVSITGKNLDVGISVTDYIIMIGQGQCEDMQLYNNRIVCSAPTNSPEPNPEQKDVNVHEVRVRIGRGGFDFSVGKILYQSSPFDNPVVIAVLVIAIVVVIALVIAGVVYAIKKGRRTKGHDDYNLTQR